MTQDGSLSDGVVLRVLGDTLLEVDPVPEEIVEFAHSIWSWPQVDTAHLALIFDSNFDETGAVRSDSDFRVLSFAGDVFVIETEYDPGDMTLAGTIHPGGRYEVEGWTGVDRVEGECDANGRFRVRPLPRGPARLVVKQIGLDVVARTEWVILSCSR